MTTSYTAPTLRYETSPTGPPAAPTGEATPLMPAIENAMDAIEGLAGDVADQASDISAAQTAAGSASSSASANANALALQPKGAVARNRKTTGTFSTSNVTPTTAVVAITTSVAVKAGRLYRVACPGLDANAAAAAYGVVQLTYTTNGSTATASSTALSQMGYLVNASGQNVPAPISGQYAPATDHVFSVALSVFSQTPSVACGVVATTAIPMHIVIEDVGVDPGLSGT